MNELAITVGIILFPGLIAAVVADKITVHSKSWGSFKYSIYSFIFGVLCYVFLQGITLTWWLITHSFFPSLTFESITLDVWSVITSNKVVISPSDVLWATALSPLVALFAAYIVNHKLINRFAQHHGISRKYGDENLYSYFLNLQNIDWVYVRDIQNSITYQGRLVSYSEAEDMQELVLSDVTLYSYVESEELYSVPFLYLSKPRGTFIIEAIPTDYLQEVSNEQEEK
ncbi:hypothetical protein [Halothiobacillus sp.]|uniref:hypothetical protein n=1 Tax=Halothiobacillus sp. TaxID=1891311 RepID=UPI0026164AFC|nr:hypothetical protein [Halothiobacillus sp.]